MNRFRSLDQLASRERAQLFERALEAAQAVVGSGFAGRSSSPADDVSACSSPAVAAAAAGQATVDHDVRMMPTFQAGGSEVYVFNIRSWAGHRELTYAIEFDRVGADGVAYHVALAVLDANKRVAWAYFHWGQTDLLEHLCDFFGLPAPLESIGPFAKKLQPIFKIHRARMAAKPTRGGRHESSAQRRERPPIEVTGNIVDLYPVFMTGRLDVYRVDLDTPSDGYNLVAYLAFCRYCSPNKHDDLVTAPPLHGAFALLDPGEKCVSWVEANLFPGKGYGLELINSIYDCHGDLRRLYPDVATSEGELLFEKHAAYVERQRVFVQHVPREARSDDRDEDHAS